MSWNWWTPNAVPASTSSLLSWSSPCVEAVGDNGLCYQSEVCQPLVSIAASLGWFWLNHADPLFIRIYTSLKVSLKCSFWTTCLDQFNSINQAKIFLIKWFWFLDWFLTLAAMLIAYIWRHKRLLEQVCHPRFAGGAGAGGAGLVAAVILNPHQAALL